MFGFSRTPLPDPAKLMFTTLAQLKQPNTNLTDRILQLFEISYGLTLDEQESNQAEEFFKQDSIVYVTPMNQSLILNLTDYFASAK